MYKEVVMPSIQNPVYQFPQEAYGKRVIVMFENEEKEEKNNTESDLEEFIFKNEEANDNLSFEERYKKAVEFFKKNSINTKDIPPYTRKSLYNE